VAKIAFKENVILDDAIVYMIFFFKSISENNFMHQNSAA